MLTKKEIQRRVNKICAEEKIKDEDILSSKQFYSLLQDGVYAILDRLEESIELVCMSNPKNEMTACTNGSEIIINTLGKLITGTLREKYLKCMGMIAHECGHILYMDFELFPKLRNAWEKGTYLNGCSHPKAESVMDMLSYYPNYKKAYLQTMKTLENVIVDIHDEKCIYSEFSGMCTKGLTLLNKELYAQSPEIKEQLKNDSKITVAIMAILLSGKGFELKDSGLEDDETWQEIKNVLNDCEEELKILESSNSRKEKAELYNVLFVKLYKLFDLPENEEEMKNSEQSDLSDEEVEKIMESLSELSKSISPEHSETGPARAPREVEIKEPEEKPEESEKESEEESKAIDEMLESVEKDIVEENVQMENEKTHESELEREFKSINDKCDVKRHLEVTREDVQPMEEYKFVLDQKLKEAEALVRKINSIWKDRETDEAQSGYLFGQRFNASDTFRGDGMYFSRISSPEGRPKVAFAILVDESGSMMGEKIQAAKEAAICINYALKKLDIPHMIMGHTTQDTRRGEELWLRSYVDFDTTDDKDSQRLCSIMAYADNLDGIAIYNVGQKLLKRPEENKVMIVISDGQPAGERYVGASADRHTKETINYLRKKGLKVFGAIVDSFESVAELYGDNYSFDCQENLDKNLIKLIKRYCV